MDTNLPGSEVLGLAVDSEQRAYGRFTRRLAAMIVDGLVTVGGMFLGALAAGTAIFALGVDVESIRVVLIPAVALLMGAVLLYEPVLVSRTGGTVGHHLLNLRVVPDEEDGHLAFRWAVLRTLIKGAMGIPSFVVMAVSGRGQALHDAISGSTVQIKDLRRARPGDYTRDRPAHEVSDVSRWRRFAVICAYMPLLWIGGYLYSRLVVPEACTVEGVCTAMGYGLNLLGNGLLTLMGGILVYLGWEGRLPGARTAQSRPLRPSPLRRWLKKEEPLAAEAIFRREVQPPVEIRSSGADV